MRVLKSANTAQVEVFFCAAPAISSLRVELFFLSTSFSRSQEKNRNYSRTTVTGTSCDDEEPLNVSNLVDGGGRKTRRRNRELCRCSLSSKRLCSRGKAGGTRGYFSVDLSGEVGTLSTVVVDV